MLIKGLKDEDFVNYKKPSMFIIMPFCSFKCDKENGCNLCQNSHLAQEPEMNMPILAIVARYKENPITKAIVCGGLEPFDSADSLANLVHVFRQYTNDDIVIYTGYEEWELLTNPYYEKILEYDNIVIKYGRFRPNQEPHYDEILGVKLASDNQYAKRYN
jgi:organic radical activating enzyme